MNWFKGADEFTLREWRRLRRPLRSDAWFPAFFYLLCVAAMAAMFRWGGAGRGFGEVALQRALIALLGGAPFLASWLFLALWWPRRATQAALTELSLTPTHPSRWARAALHPQRALLAMVLAPLALLPVISAVRFYFILPAISLQECRVAAAGMGGILSALTDALILLALALHFGSFARGLLIAGLFLLLFHPSLLLAITAGIPGNTARFLQENFVTLETASWLTKVALAVLAVSTLRRVVDRHLARRAEEAKLSQ